MMCVHAGVSSSHECKGVRRSSGTRCSQSSPQTSHCTFNFIHSFISIISLPLLIVLTARENQSSRAFVELWCDAHDQLLRRRHHSTRLQHRRALPHERPLGTHPSKYLSFITTIIDRLILIWLDFVSLMIDICSVVAEQFSIRLGSYSLPELFRQELV